MKKIFLFLPVAFFLIEKQLSGQASLAAENIIDDIQVTTKFGKKKVYTVCRDNAIKNQWYYFPNELRIAEELDQTGKVKPKMSILRYQYQDPMTGQSKEGGILVAVFTFAVEPEVVIDINKAITAKTGEQNIRLSAIPLNSCTIDFLAASGDFLGEVEAKNVSGLGGATSASQEMVISINLTALGAGVISALATGAGIPIRANITYNGLTAPCGYKIKGKWNNVYKYFENNKIVEGRANFWVFSGGGSYSKSTIKESLETMQDMKVEVVECMNTSGADSVRNALDDANMYNMVESIRKEVFNDTMLNRVAELAKLQEILKTNKSVADQLTELIDRKKNMIQVGYQQSIKNVEKRRTGEINYDFARQRMIIRPSTFGGLISFSKYGFSEDQLKSQGYLVDIDAGQAFPSVIIGLPNIPTDYSLRAVTLNVSFTNSDGQTTSSGRQWKVEKGGWVTPTGAELGYMRFNLIGEKNKTRLSEPEFNVKLEVVSKIANASFVIERKVKLSRGERYLDAIELLTKQYIINGSSLDFKIITNNTQDLAYAKFIFSGGNVTINDDLTPYFNNNVAGPPGPVYLMMPNTDVPIEGKVIYYLENGKQVERKETLKPGKNTLANYEWKTIN